MNIFRMKQDNGGINIPSVAIAREYMSKLVSCVGKYLSIGINNNIALINVKVLPQGGTEGAKGLVRGVVNCLLRQQGRTAGNVVHSDVLTTLAIPSVGAKVHSIISGKVELDRPHHQDMSVNMLKGVGCYSSIVLLWNKYLVDLFYDMKKCITEILSEMITGLKTLNFGLRGIQGGSELKTYSNMPTGFLIHMGYLNNASGVFTLS